jgi:GGDEF domain-containing protein
MPNHKPTLSKIKELEKMIRERDEIIARLSQDPSYGILSRQALEIDLEHLKLKRTGVFVVFGDIDHLHNFNAAIGHEEANRRIRSALHFRETDVRVHLKGKWYSGDEIAIVAEGDPESFCRRQKEAFIREGMSISLAWVPFTGKIEKDVARAEAIVDKMKAERPEGNQR